MSTISTTTIKRSFVALAAFSLIAVSTPAAFAQSEETSGQTDTGTTVSTPPAVNNFGDNFALKTTNFQMTVLGYADAARASLEAEGNMTTVPDFVNAFNAASDSYNTAVVKANETYLQQVENAANNAESKDQFIDLFNNAKANYFNTLEVAKNNLANELSSYGGVSDQIKNDFINNYNVAKDTYGNEVEAIKNSFASQNWGS